jgi:hypothetical protein
MITENALGSQIFLTLFYASLNNSTHCEKKKIIIISSITLSTDFQKKIKYINYRYFQNWKTH